MLRVRVGDFKLGRREKKIINKVLDIGHLSEGAKVFDCNGGCRSGSWDYL